jgi:Mg2+ and Co2+ transporter CorA
MNSFLLTINYHYSPAYRGYRNSLYVPEEPDEPDTVSIYEIIDEYGCPLVLSDETIEQIEEHILKHHGND